MVEIQRKRYEKDGQMRQFNKETRELKRDTPRDTLRERARERERNKKTI